MAKCKNCTCENGIKRCVSNGVVDETACCGWISLKDKMPPEETMVFLWSDRICVGMYYMGNFWSCPLGNDFIKEYLREVSHWRPLLKPPCH